MKYRTVQTMMLPDCAEENYGLYYQGTGGIQVQQGEKKSLSVPENEKADLFTYFNGFYPKQWSQYAQLDGLRIKVTVSGNCRVLLCHIDGSRTVVDEEKESRTAADIKNELVFEVSDVIENIAAFWICVESIRNGIDQNTVWSDLGIQGIGHGARKLNVSRVQSQVEVMTRNARDRQVTRSYIRCNAHHVIGNFARQFDGNRAVNGALVIAIELANLERRALDFGQVLGCRIEGNGPRCHATAFNYAHWPAGDVFDLDRARRHVQVKRCERVGIKRFARKLLRPNVFECHHV